MKTAVFPVLFKILLLLTFLLTCAGLRAQNLQATTENNQELEALNKTLASDKQKQAELLNFYGDKGNQPLHRDDTIALYLADLDVVIDISKRQNISYPIKLMDDCRELLRNDLRELTENGVRAGYPFKKISATNDAYLQEIFREYKNRYRPGWRYGQTVPEFGRADYLKAIKNIFTTIVTLKVSSFTEGVKVVVYAMQGDKFIASSTGTTEFVRPLESGAYIVELSKPGYKKKLKKVVLGKYPRTITINEGLVLQ
jgi:hypothetical protein